MSRQPVLAHRSHSLLRPSITVLLALAGGIHLGTALAHRATTSHLTFFTVIGLLQLVAAAVIFRSNTARAPLAVAAILSLAVSAVWIASRAWGVPFGPSPGRLPVGLTDGVATLAQLTVVGLVLSRATGTSRFHRHAPPAFVTGLAAAAVAVAGFVPGIGHVHPLHDHADDLGTVAVGAAHDHGAGNTPDHHGPNLSPDHGPDLLDLRRQATDPTVGEALAVGAGPSAVAVRDGVVWVANGRDGTVTRYDAATFEPLGAPTPVGAGPTSIAFGAGAAWVTSADPGAVVRLGLDSGRVLGTAASVGKLARDVAVGDTHAWSVSAYDGLLHRLDLRTGAVVGEPEFIGYGPQSLAIADGVVWIVNTLDREVVRVDESTGERIGDPIRVGAGSTDVVVAHDAVWIASATDGTVRRLDPVTGDLLAPPTAVDDQPQIGGGPYALVATDAAVWVANNDELTLTALDPATGLPLGPPVFTTNYHTEVPRGPSLAAANGELWLSIPGDDHIVRVSDPSAA